MRTISRRLGIGLGLGLNGSGAGGGGNTWYARPSGGTYGDEDGTSYDNAWDGFVNIDWTASGVQPGDTLIIAGTHTETLTIGGSGTASKSITIRGDYSGDAGVVDSEDLRAVGISIISKNYITLESISSIDATTSCLSIEGTSTGIITNSFTASGSGNQGVQHLATASATHNNLTSTGNVDDGVSGHDDSVIVINTGTITGNAEGINVIANATCNATNITFGTNTNYDIFATNATTPGSSIITVNDSTIAGEVYASADGKVILNNCTVNGAVEIASASTMSYIEATDTVFNAAITMGVNSTSSYDSCLLTSIANVVATTAIINMTDCYVTDAATYAGELTATRTLFENSSSIIVDMTSGGDADITYCVFDGMGSVIFALALRTGSTGIIDNNSFVGVSNVGRGLFLQVNTTVNNNIFTGLEIGLLRSAGTIVSNNSCFYDNTTDISGTVTNTDPQTTDPLLTDVANNDFSLDTGSSCIGTGKTLTEATGIDTATWGNGTTETPEVTTKEQTSPWDIGAYVNGTGEGAEYLTDSYGNNVLDSYGNPIPLPQ